MIPSPDLRARGWTLEGHPPMLVRPPGPLPPSTRPAPALTIQPVADGDALKDWERVIVDGFPFPELQPLVPGSLVDVRLLDEPRGRLLVGDVQGQPVCAAALFVTHEVAQLWLAATLAQARRRGYYDANARYRRTSSRTSRRRAVQQQEPPRSGGARLRASCPLHRLDTHPLP